MWDVLHDAIIVRIDAEVPGDLTLEIECDYLRDRFDVPGERFFLTVRDCKRFAFHPWSGQSITITDLKALAARRLWLLRAESADGYCKIHCNEHVPKGNGGELHVAASGVDLRIDDGTRISLAELTRVANEYWEEWSSSSGH